MKKLTAIMLVAMLVFSATCMMVSADDNLALNADYTVTGCGTGYTNLTGQWPSKYDADITDGYASDELNFGTDSTWFAFYHNAGADASLINAPDGVGAVTVDLGDVYDISSIKVHFGNHYANGVNSPNYAHAYVSVDGEEFTKVGEFEIKDAEEAANAVLAYWSEVEADASARYIKLEVSLRGVFAFFDEIEVYGAAGEPAPSAPTYDETYSEDPVTGDASYEVAYGYTFTIGSVNGIIKGEDTTIITTNDAYAVCNPNWAISAHVKSIGDNKFEVIKVVATPGSAADAGITLADGEYVFVVHSSTSNPERAEEFPNWQQKVVALALKAGDVLTASGLDLAAGTVTDATFYVEIPSGNGGGNDDDDVVDTYEDDIKAAMGEADPDADYTVTLTGPATYESGDVIEIVATVNAAAGVELISVDFDLFYDVEKLTLTNATAGDGSLDCATTLPNSNWENLTQGEGSDSGKVHVAFGNAASADGITDETALVLTFTFTVNDGAEGKLGVYVANNDAIYGNDYDFGKHIGAGDYVVVSPEVVDDGGNGGSTDPNGDNGINVVVFAVIALVSICGTAIVIKARG